MAVWSEVVRDSDFFEKTCLGEMMRMHRQIIGHEWGQQSRFGGFETGDRHEIEI